MSTGNTEQLWSRSKYPLLPSSHGSTPSSPTSQSEKDSVPPLAQLLEKGPAPWYHAVTAEGNQQSGNNINTDLSSLRLNENDGRMDHSSATYSTSQHSTSPPSVAALDPHFHHSELGPPEPQQTTTQPLAGPWSNDAYQRPSIDQTSASPEYDVSEPEHDFSPDQSPELSPSRAPGRTRTLRRTPRSRRITSPVTVEDIKPPHKPSEDGGSIVVSISNPWKRHGYPLHSPVTDLTTQHPPPPPYQKDSASPDAPTNESSQSEDSRNVSSNNASWHRQLEYSRQTPTAASHTESTASDGSSVTAAEPSDQNQDVGAALSLQKPARRPTYPLQSPASVANLKRSPTPPHSASESEQTPTSEVSEQSKQKPSQALPPKSAPVLTYTPATPPIIAPKAKSLRRQAYPLQSPASVASLHGEVTPPPSPHSDSDSDSTLQDNPPSPSRQTFRRQKYPLQQPARIAVHQENTPRSLPKEALSRAPDKPSQPPAERPPPADHNFSRPSYPIQPQTTGSAPPNSLTAEKPSEEPAEQTPQRSVQTESHNSKPKPTQPKQQAGLSAPLVKSSRRQKYPLQSPASHANLAEQAESFSPPSQARGQSKLAEHTLADDVHDKSKSATGKADGAPRSGYPVQDVPTIRVESQEHDEVSTKDSRERDLAAKVIKKWRREKYPLQSPKDMQPFERPTTPQPPEYEAPKHHHPKKIHLPKNIRAVKDAEDTSDRGRTIVVCLDGTGDKFDNDNSNIVHIVSALKKDDPQQVTYYQAGIGTYGDQGLTSGFAAAADMAVGSGLGLHVRDAYHFLMHTYKEGDRICIFGFSRGAYTARCLAGMIHKVGLLPPRNIQQIYFAYQFYTDTSKEGWVQSDLFKRTFSIDVNVYLLGCFDSVASVGFIPRQLPLSSTPTNKSVYFRHAMALDERRAKFKICRHQKAGWADEVEPAEKAEAVMESITEKAHQALPNFKTQNDVPPGYHKPQKYGTEYHPNVTDEEYEELKGHGPPFETDVHEVWFAGAHADVGGGAVPNDERHKLAQIPLRWMIRQAFECNTGIIFKTKILAEFGLDVHTLWPKYERLNAPLHAPPPSILEKYSEKLPPRHIRRDKLVPTEKHVDGEPGYHLVDTKDEDWTPELVEDFYDAMSPLNDQLIQAPTWWILEFMPVQYKVPLAPGEVEVRTGMNWGRYRGVEDLEPKMHWTVRHRMQNTNYKVLARTAKNTNWRVVV